jgi:hypothetical protein
VLVPQEEVFRLSEMHRQVLLVHFEETAAAGSVAKHKASQLANEHKANQLANEHAQRHSTVECASY